MRRSRDFVSRQVSGAENLRPDAVRDKDKIMGRSSSRWVGARGDVLAELSLVKRGPSEKPQAGNLINASTSVPGGFIESFARGLDVLLAFSVDMPEPTLSEIAARTKLTPATARRCLLTLVELGYVGQIGKRFVLRHKVLSFGSAYLDAIDIRAFAQPFLQVLRDQTDDSCSLTLLSETDIVHISHVPSNRLLQFYISPGSRIPAYISSSGRVLLAHLEEDRLASYFEQAELLTRTDRTITSVTKLRAELEKVRTQGFAVVQDELEYGVISLAVPIRGQASEVVSGLSCSTSSRQVQRKKMVESRLPLLREAANQIELALRQYPTFLHSIQSRYGKMTIATPPSEIAPAISEQKKAHAGV